MTADPAAFAARLRELCDLIETNPDPSAARWELRQLGFNVIDEDEPGIRAARAYAAAIEALAKISGMDMDEEGPARGMRLAFYEQTAMAALAQAAELFGGELA